MLRAYLLYMPAKDLHVLYMPAGQDELFHMAALLSLEASQGKDKRPKLRLRIGNAVPGAESAVKPAYRTTTRAAASATIQYRFGWIQ